MKYNDNGEWKEIQVKVANAIQNEYGDSQNDGYSQNYLNEHILNVSNEVDEDYRVNVLHSKNLFDINSKIENSTISSGGVITNNSGTNIYYIPIEYGKNYIMSFIDNSTGGNVVWGFSNTIPYIGVSCTYNVNTCPQLNNKVFTAPSSSNKYLCIRLATGGGQLASMSNIQIEEGNTTTSYEPYITPSIYVDGDTIVSKMAKVNYFNSSWLESGFYVHTNSNYFYKNADGLITFQIGIKTSNAISTATAFPIMTIPNELMPKANTIFAGYSYQKGAMATYIRKSDNKFLIKPFVALSADDEINISGSYYLED